MSAVLPTLSDRRVTWVRVEAGFHVASRAGEFVGFAERTSDGHVVGFDGRSTPIGRYDSLERAKRAVESAPAGVAPSRSVAGALSPARLQVAATATGLLALGVLAVATVIPGV